MQRYMQRHDGDREPMRERYWNHCRPCEEGPWVAHLARTRGVRALGYKDYEAYVASPHWRSIRQSVLEAQRTRLQRNMCEGCGSDGGGFDVHHKTYERLGNELVEDCQVLCKQCHDKLHGRDPKGQSRHYADR
jgi:5-methylcytosine-specific restriction endonuclease McrA